jgi:hypothetical protein
MLELHNGWSARTLTGWANHHLRQPPGRRSPTARRPDSAVAPEHSWGTPNQLPVRDRDDHSEWPRAFRSRDTLDRVNTSRPDHLTSRLFRRQFVLGPRPVSGLQDWNRLTIDDRFFLAVHPDLDVCSVRLKDLTIILLGYILDPERPSATNVEILEAVANTASTFEDLIESTKDKNGRFALIVRVDDQYRILHDAIGYRQVFFHRDSSGGVWCASQPSLIAAILGLAVDEGIRGDLWQLPLFRQTSGYWYPGNITLYRDIFHLYSNHYLDLINGEVTRYWPRTSINRLSIEAAVSRCSELLRGTFASAIHRFDLGLTITSGYDCRVLLSACRDLIKDIHFVTHTHQQLDESGEDIQIPKAMLKRFELPHHVARHTEDIDRSFHQDFVTSVTGAKKSAEQNAYAFYTLFQSLDQEIVVALGEGGGLGKTVYRLPSLIKPNPKSLATLARMRGSHTAETAFGDWLETTESLLDKGMMITDLFYWEMRLGNWSTLAISCYDLVFESLLPFNCRSVLETLIGVDEEYRRPPNYTHVHLVEEMWPELLDFPINPRFRKTEALVQGIKKQKWYDGLRDLKFLYHYLFGS